MCLPRVLLRWTRDARCHRYDLVEREPEHQAEQHALTPICAPDVPARQRVDRTGFEGRTVTRLRIQLVSRPALRWPSRQIRLLDVRQAVAYVADLPSRRWPSPPLPSPSIAGDRRVAQLRQRINACQTLARLGQERKRRHRAKATTRHRQPARLRSVPSSPRMLVPGPERSSAEWTSTHHH